MTNSMAKLISAGGIQKLKMFTSAMDRQTYTQIKQMTRKVTPDLMRTFMANERTFLSFIRTSLALLILAFSFIKFFDSLLIAVIGYTFIFSHWLRSW